MWNINIHNSSGPTARDTLASRLYPPLDAVNGKSMSSDRPVPCKSNPKRFEEYAKPSTISLTTSAWMPKPTVYKNSSDLYENQDIHVWLSLSELAETMTNTCVYWCAFIGDIKIHIRARYIALSKKAPSTFGRTAHVFVLLVTFL